MSEATAPQTIEERLQWLCDNGDKWQRKAESAEADANQLAEALEAIVQGLGGLAILPLGLTRRMVDAACKALDKHKERGGG